MKIQGNNIDFTGYTDAAQAGKVVIEADVGLNFIVRKKQFDPDSGVQLPSAVTNLNAQTIIDQINAENQKIAASQAYIAELTQAQADMQTVAVAAAKAQQSVGP